MAAVGCVGWGGAGAGADVAGEARDKVDEEGAGAPAALYYYVLYHIILYYIVKSHHIKYRIFSSILHHRPSSLAQSHGPPQERHLPPAAKTTDHCPPAVAARVRARDFRGPDPSKSAPRLGSAYAGPPHKRNRRRRRRRPSGPHAPT